MTPTLLDIVTAHIGLRQSHDRRPWLVIEIRPSRRYLLLPISSATDLFDRIQHFPLDPRHPDFPATGLTKTSYIIGNNAVENDGSAFDERLGCLQGNLAKEFIEWFG